MRVPSITIIIIANDVSNKDIGFDSDDNEVTLITEKEKHLIERKNKRKVSKKNNKFHIGEDQ